MLYFSQILFPWQHEKVYIWEMYYLFFVHPLMEYILCKSLTFIQSGIVLKEHTKPRKCVLKITIYAV